MMSLQEEVNKTLGEKATYITMLRDPIDVFESLWNYAKLYNFYHMGIETFALMPKTGLLTQVIVSFCTTVLLDDVDLSILVQVSIQRCLST